MLAASQSNGLYGSPPPSQQEVDEILEGDAIFQKCVIKKTTEDGQGYSMVTNNEQASTQPILNDVASASLSEHREIDTVVYSSEVLPAAHDRPENITLNKREKQPKVSSCRVYSYEF